MATIRLVPSTYSLSNSSYLSVSDASNMYNNTDNETYATITNSRSSTSSYYAYIKGFNFDDVPSDATINSFTVKIKIREQGGSTSSSYGPRLVNNTTTISSNSPTMSTSVQTITFSSVTADWDTIKGYGSNFGIRVNCRRASRSTTSYIYIYGAEILVDYTPNVTYSLSTTITNGTFAQPTISPIEVPENSDYEILFQGDADTTFQSMTVNGTVVTPTEKTITPTLPTFTLSTNYGTYSGSLDNVTDDDSSTYWWASNAQTTGYYVLLTFSDYINLNSFSTYSSNSTDYVHSNNQLQVSADNSTWTSVGTFTDSTTSTFSNIGAKNVKYVRIYATSDIENWLYLNTITVSYESAQEAGTYYSYTITSISNNVDVVVVFSKGEEALYIKLNGAWAKIGKTYQKTNGQWVEISYVYDSTKKMIYKGAV